MNDHHNPDQPEQNDPEQSDEEARSRARHPSGKSPVWKHRSVTASGGHPTADACLLAGEGHFHISAPEEPTLDGSLASTEVVFYRHVLDTRCHGLVSWRWSLDLSDTDDESVEISGPTRVIGFTEDEAVECDYCMFQAGQADEAITEQAKHSYSRFHMDVARRSTRIMAEMRDLPDRPDQPEPTTGLDSLRAFFRGESK